MANKKDLRGSIEKMREVAELLSGWADDMERSLEKKTVRKTAGTVAENADAAPAPALSEVAEPAVAEEPVAPAVPTAPSFEEVRGLLAAKSAAGCRTQVLALIRSYGAEKLSEVDPAHYAELMEAASGLGGDGDAG